MSLIGSTFKRLLQEEGFTRLWTSLAVAVCAVGGGVAVYHYHDGDGPCDLEATTANFSTKLSTAASGQTICLASGDYGTFTGTNKAITIRAAGGASPQMFLNLGTGDSSFTLDGMTEMGGDITGGVSDVTIKNSDFTDSLDIEGENENIVLDHNTHNWAAVFSGGINAKIFLGDTGRSHSLSAPAVTIKNSEFKNGDLDGIHIGDGGGGYIIQGNVFQNLCDTGTNHTDNIQVGANDPRIYAVKIADNYIQADSDCSTQGITSFDAGTDGFIIENNVVDIYRTWGIEWYADDSSIIRHNTVVWHARVGDTLCDAGDCGHIDINAKVSDPTSTGTHVYDNVAVVDLNSCDVTCAEDHNVAPETAVYVGSTDHHDGFLLDGSSPVGLDAASDGSDSGVYASGH